MGAVTSSVNHSRVADMNNDEARPETEDAMDQRTDTELWTAVRAGNADAFGVLFDRHGPTIHRYAVRRTGDLHQADDITATVFLEAWRTRRRMRPTRATVLPWLYGITNNVLHNWRRSRRRHTAAVDRIVESTRTAAPRAGERDTAELVGTVDEARRILRGVGDLPRRELDVLALAAWEGLSMAQIAAALGIPRGTVKSRLNRARRRLAAATPDPGDPSCVPAPAVSRTTTIQKEFS